MKNEKPNKNEKTRNQRKIRKSIKTKIYEEIMDKVEAIDVAQVKEMEKEAISMSEGELWLERPETINTLDERGRHKLDTRHLEGRYYCWGTYADGKPWRMLLDLLGCNRTLVTRGHAKQQKLFMHPDIREENVTLGDGKSTIPIIGECTIIVKAPFQDVVLYDIGVVEDGSLEEPVILGGDFLAAYDGELTVDAKNRIIYLSPNQDNTVGVFDEEGDPEILENHKKIFIGPGESKWVEVRLKISKGRAQKHVKQGTLIFEKGTKGVVSTSIYSKVKIGRGIAELAEVRGRPDLLKTSIRVVNMRKEGLTIGAGRKLARFLPATITHPKAEFQYELAGEFNDAEEAARFATLLSKGEVETQEVEDNEFTDQMVQELMEELGGVSEEIKKDVTKQRQLFSIIKDAMRTFSPEISVNESTEITRVDPDVIICRCTPKMNCTPVYQTFRRRRPDLMKAEEVIVKDLLTKGLIEPGDGPWASPTVLARKSDGTIRFCVDYR